MVVSCSFGVCVWDVCVVIMKTTLGVNRGTERSWLDAGSRDRRPGRGALDVWKKQCSSRGSSSEGRGV